jgi:hypothetical protein
VPIRRGHYLFRDAIVQRSPKYSRDWIRNCWHYTSECEAAVRRALRE